MLAILGLAGLVFFFALGPSSAPNQQRLGRAASSERTQGGLAPVGGVSSQRSATVPGVSSVADPSPPARFAFDALTAGREPVKTEVRMFQAQKWEPDIAKNLNLPPGTPLQRRSTWYRISELKFPLVRVDRIYRMDRAKGGATGPVAPQNKTASGPLAPPSTRSQATGPVAPPSAPEGELLWDNAMIADHLMVQTQLGVSQSQLQRALPSPCRILSAVNAQKGLYLVAVPSEEIARSNEPH